MARVVSSIRGRGHLFHTPALSTDNATKTTRVTADLARAIARSSCPTPQAQDRIAQRLAHDIVGMDPLPAALREAITTAIAGAVRVSLADLYAAPRPGSPHDPLAAYNTRQDVQARLAYFTDEANQLAAFRNQLGALFQSILRAAPQRRPAAGALSISTPLYATFTDPIGVIDELVRTLATFATDPNDPAKRPGTRLGDAIIENLLSISRLTFEEAQKRPYRIVWPAESKVSVDEVVATYLAGTPFERLLATPLERMLPNDLLPEGVLVTAHPGHGKTQWLQSTVLRLLDDPSRPSVVIMDSQGDAIRVLAPLARFNPARGHNLTIIDPTDPWPPALNLFAWNRALAGTLTEMQREEMIAGVIETFRFTCEGLFGIGLTPRMQLVFQYLTLWILEIPDANLLTLIQLLRDPAPYLRYTRTLSPTAQGFIDELFAENSPYQQTREHILARLHAVVANPLFERMFAHPQSKFDIGAAMNTPGHVTIINTAKSQLKAECSSLFGRFWLARIYQATMARAFIPREQRRLSVVLIDEAHEYLQGAESTVGQLLFQARKYRVSLAWLHQSLEQFRKAGVLAPMLGVPALRFTGAISDADANALAREMRTTPEHLLSLRKTANSAEWAVYARNLTPTAATTTVPFFAAEREPKMTPAAYQALLEANRRRVGAPRHPPRAVPAPVATPTPRRINNGGQRY